MYSAEQPSPRPVSRAELLAVGIILAVAAYLRLRDVDLGYLSIHTTRDLYRSQLLLRGVEFPLLGSELQYGGRVLGPLMYLLCAIPLAISTSPVSIAVLIAVLNTALIGVVWRFTRAHFGPGAALWTAAMYAVFPLEISQLRFYWNPCFLPAVVTGALICLFGVAVRGHPWQMLGVALFICLGLQLHISAAELIVSCAVVLLIAHRHIPARVWLGVLAVALILFSPMIIHELTAERANLADVLTSPDTERGGLERFAFNPNGVKNFFYHVRLQMHEEGGSLGFVYLSTVPMIGSDWLEGGTMVLAEVINTWGLFQLLFWGAGVGVCLEAIRTHWRRRRTLMGEKLEASRARMVAHAALLVWQAVPVLFLSFFNYQGFPGQPPSLSPIRYYLVTYPAPFITSGLGVMALANLGAPGRRPLRLTIFGLGLILLASHIAFDHIYLTVLERSGRMISYRWPNMAPNMRTMMEVRDILLGEARLDRDAHYERTHSQQLGLVYFGEATFDWLITQDPRSVTNPPSDPHTRWLLHSRYVNPPEHSAEPRLPPGAEEVRRWTIRDIGITIVEYRVVDPLEPVPEEENFMMRNFYHREGRMLYLGPERELRERTRP